MLAHLSHTRDTYIDLQNDRWPVAHMSFQILEQVEFFLHQLSPDMRLWFPSSEQISNRKSQAFSFLENPNE